MDEKQPEKKSFLQKVPGFRSGKLWKKSIACWFYAFIVMVICIAIIDPSSDSPDTQADAPQQQEQKIDLATVELTEENIKTALAIDENFPKDITIVVEGGVVNAQYEPGAVWDETDLIKKVGSASIIAGGILFESPYLECLTVTALTEMTDQYGNAETKPVTSITINRATADKINWEGVDERHITDPGNIYRIANDFVIHPGVLKNVKLDKVKLY